MFHMNSPNQFVKTYLQTISKKLGSKGNTIIASTRDDVLGHSSWVVGDGSWVMGDGSSVKDRGSWVVGDVSCEFIVSLPVARLGTKRHKLT